MSEFLFGLKDMKKGQKNLNSINILFDALIQNACVNQGFVSETNLLSDCIMNYYNLPNIQRNNILTSLYYMINKIAKEEIYNINISIRDNQVFFN